MNNFRFGVPRRRYENNRLLLLVKLKLWLVSLLLTQSMSVQNELEN
jgi:hypothetical protein